MRALGLADWSENHTNMGGIVKTIMYRVQYTGVRMVAGSTGYVARSEDGGPEFEFVQVRARDINSGYSKALMLAREPLGSGERREIGAIEVWSSTSTRSASRAGFCEVR